MILSKMTTQGFVGFGLGLSIAASAFPQLRIPMFGFQLHLCVALAFLSLPILLVKPLERFPKRLTLSAAIFLVIVIAACAASPKAMARTVLKSVCFFLMVLAGYHCVRKREDLLMTILGVGFSSIIICARGFAYESVATHGVNPFEGVANKNAFSLYVLPALLLMTAQILNERKHKFLRVLLIVLSLFTVYTIFSSANRSGWLGVGVILLFGLLSTGLSFRRVVMIGVLALGSASIIYGSSRPRNVIETRMNDAYDRDESDQLRRKLILASLQVLIRNPILGASPDRLHRELPKYLNVRGHGLKVNTHNLFAFLFGAFGLTGGIAYLVLGYNYLGRLRTRRHRLAGIGDSWVLGFSLLILYVIRSMFTHEIMYNPSFGFCFGLVLALTTRQWITQYHRSTPKAWVFVPRRVS